MASLALGVKFIATSAGTVDFVYASAVAGYVGPAATLPAMVNGKTYRYRAESVDLTQWEWGYGVYTASTQTIARTTITLSSTGAKVSFTAAPTVGVVPFPDDILQFDDAMPLTAAQQAQARGNLGVPAANLIINGDFRVNQAGYVSAAVLAAGSYGHDQWKAGASGGDYSFTQLKSSTQITIAVGKSLIQPIEDANVVGGSYVLSWTGTAQARAGVNTLTPAGSYASSPLLIVGQTAATAMSVEFNSGTLGAVKLESGASATPFIMRPFDQELTLCQRYFCSSFPPGTAPANASTSGIYSGTAFSTGSMMSPRILFPVRMRATPTVTLYSSNQKASPVANQWQYYASGTTWTDLTGTTANGAAVDGVTVQGNASLTLAASYIISGGYAADARL